MAKPKLRYDKQQVPEGGWSVQLGVTTIAGSKEPVGTAFHSKVRAAVGAAPSMHSTDSCSSFDNSVDDSDAEAAATGGRSSSDSLSGFVDPRRDTRRLNASKGKKGRLQKDYYGYLGLGHSRWQATNKDIEKAYKTIALRFHPDKCAGPGASEREREAVEERFKLIGEAYEVLMDPRKRREFDSVDGGDDNLPTACDEGKFFETFAPAVERMARWSARSPVPRLGDENTPFNEVEKFYRFWHQFKSWREFPQDDEYDLEDAEGREHKRWMQKENEKMRKKAKQDESQRISAFVRAMEAHDPRMQEKKEAERRRREEKKEARRSSSRKPQQDSEQEQQAAGVGERSSSVSAASSENTSAFSRATEQQDDDTQDPKDKKQLRKERQKLRKEAQRASDQLSDQKAVETLCNHCSMKYLKRLNDILRKRSDGTVIAKVITKEAKRLNNEEIDEADDVDIDALASEAGKEPVANGEAQEQVNAQQFSSDETNTILQELNKYPKGSVKEEELWSAIGQKLGRKPSDVYRYYWTHLASSRK